MAWYRTEEFKREFKVGDIITRGPGYPMVITAIGEKRFLFRPLGERCQNNSDERVATMSAYGTMKPFRKWDKDAFPDSQYVYCLEREERLNKE